MVTYNFGFKYNEEIPPQQTLTISPQNINIPNQTQSIAIETNIKKDIDNVIKKYNLSQLEINNIHNYTTKKPLIVHCCHHKTGTVVIEKVLRAVAAHFRLKYQYCPQTGLEDDTDIWLQHHSQVDFSKIDRPVIGTHMIRNPCAIIVSAYEYHKTTIEQWANRKIKMLGGVTYKGILNTLDLENGLIFEMKNNFYVESSKNTIMDIYNWDYKMPNFLELKFEDLMMDYNGTLINMFKHYGFSREMIDTSLEIVQKYNLMNKKEEDLIKNKHVTNKNMDLEKWKEYFRNPVICKRFWKIYPEDLFEKINYTYDNLKKLEESLELGKKSKSLFMTQEEKLQIAKENIWKKYNGENPFVF